MDGIIPEPLGGAHADTELMYANLTKEVMKHYKEIKEIDTDALIEQRIEKFSSMGVVHE